MSQSMLSWRRVVVPAIVFAAVMGGHFMWKAVFPEQNPVQSQWESVTVEDSSWLSSYIERRSYWEGYSYALSLAFAVVALRRFRERRLFGARKVALGGATLSGFLAVTGCFLAGCCGSPMLGVYLSLFGASFLPFAKPLIGVTTTLVVAVSYWWMVRRSRVDAKLSVSAPCADGCACGGGSSEGAAAHGSP